MAVARRPRGDVEAPVGVKAHELAIGQDDVGGAHDVEHLPGPNAFSPAPPVANQPARVAPRFEG